MNRYQKGLIYKLVCNDTSVKECYIGSCCNFSRRKAAHKYSCNNEKSRAYNLKNYKFIREHGGWCNWSMVLIKYFPCDNKRELEAQERVQLELNGGSLNCKVPTRTNKEYREDNKEYYQEYYEKNKEQIAEQKKEYKKKNKEKIKEKDKEYRENNKEKIKNKKAEKITCECGVELRKDHLSRHKNTKKHIDFTSNLI